MYILNFVSGKDTIYLLSRKDEMSSSYVWMNSFFLFFCGKEGEGGEGEAGRGLWCGDG